MKRIMLPAFGLLLVSAALFGQENPTRGEPAAIEGTVTKLGTGEPLPDVRVTATGASGARKVTTDAQGRFVITDLAPGTYNLDASATLFARARRNSLNLNVSRGQHLRDVNIQLVPTGVITGHVYDQNGQPLPSVSVEALRYQYRDGAKVFISAGHGQSDDRGEYRIFNLQPDVYYLRATPSPSSQAALAPVYYPSSADPQDGVPVKVVPDTESSAIDMPLGRSRTSSVRLKVAFAGNQGQGVVFTVVRKDRGVPEIMTFQTKPLGDGAYRLWPFAPGAYEIFAQAQGAASQMDIQTGRMSVNIANYEVDAGMLAVRPNGTLAGRIMAADPLPVALDPARIEITFRPMAGSPSTLKTTSRDPGGMLRQDGTFTIPNVADGYFRIEVTGLPANVYLTSARYGGMEVMDSGIDIIGGAQGSLALYLGGPGSVGAVEGVVKTREDQPAGNSLVMIVPAPNRRENPAAFRTVITDQVGSFSVPGLLPGEYTLLAFEDVDADAFQNPELLRDFESSGIKVIVERGRRNILEVRVIPKSTH